MVAKTSAVLATLLVTANAFAPSTVNLIIRTVGPLNALSDDVSVQALSDYMAKSHEEKLRAIKEVENKKNAEIAVSCIPCLRF